MAVEFAERPQRRRRIASIPSVLLMGLLAAVSACGTDGEAVLRGLVRETPLDASGVVLPEIVRTDPGGEPSPFAVRAEPGEILLVYFGFTSCPDVCPTTLFDLRAALARLGEDAQRVSLAMITVDPERDTPQALVGYLGGFTDRFHALRTTDVRELVAAQDAFLASSAITTTDDGEIEVAHTAVTYAVDDRGIVLVEWPFGVSVDTLENDLAILVDREAAAVGPS
jgi:protein SCO1/2